MGNLTVGGTGKTPMVEYLIERSAAPDSASTKQTVILSRGYGRQTKGFRIANDQDTAGTIGDEPLQLFRKYGHRVRVAVGERRADAIAALEQIFPQTRLILLDDAFQHRAVRPNITLLLSDYNRPFYTDTPFPAGRLRERRHGAARADAVIVTKCPGNLSMAEQQQITTAIRRYTRPDAPVFFATLHYAPPVSFAPDSHQKAIPNRLVLVSGLANADPLEAYVRERFTLLKHYRFADHYAYTRADLDRIIRALPAGAALLTTEKDWVKLAPLLTPAERQTKPFYYLPVAMQPLPHSAAAFEQFVDQILKKT